MKGSRIWYLQRYTSLFILTYFIYIAYFIFTNDLNFFSWSDFFLSFQTRFFTSMVFIFILIHSFIGLWTIGTDYLTKRTLGFLSKPLANSANILRNVYYFVFVLLGIIYLAFVLYIIWL
tara:strand:+ start:397 stop:753 length:357 start_codon:yes stop_codon:yes gene_type:complete